VIIGGGLQGGSQAQWSTAGEGKLGRRLWEVSLRLGGHCRLLCLKTLVIWQKYSKFQFPQVSNRLKAAPKQCPHASPMFVVLPLYCCLPRPCALLHYDLDVGVLASTHSTGGACCASARLDIWYGYHLPSFHRPLEVRLHLESANTRSTW
jgi:hypothetical protein